MPATPLLARHQKAGARLAEEAGWRMPLDFGDAEAEHRACREGAIVMDLSNRGKLAFSGPDAPAFLHGMLTNRVQDLTPGEGVYAAFLTRQGKFVSDLHLYRGEGELLALVPAGLSAPLAEALDHFIIMDQVEVADRTEALCALGVFGPKAPAAVRQAGLPWPGLPEHGHVTRDEVLSARELWTGEEGCLLLAPASRAEGLWDALAAAGARPAGLRALETLTLEAGVPLFGPDMGPEVNPMQAGLEARAIDFQKGCYVGQEVIAKIKYLGQVNRGLAGIRLEGSETPPAGAGVWHGGEEAGEVTRAALSPTLMGGIAFAYLRRKALEPGTAVRVRWEGGECPGRVAELPFYRPGGG
ncbi:MAG: aminomethyltransferase family protein [Nitrospinota bacterium]